MRVVRLGDVCKIISGSTPKREIAEYWGGDIQWVTPKEINRLDSPFLWGSAEKITEAGFKSCSTTMLPVGSLLLSSRAPIGLLAINKVPVCTNQGFKSLIPSKEVNVEYLYYVLKANVSSLQARGNGATFKELAKPAVENFEIPLPPLNDQIRIAIVLSKVEGLIALRKKHLQQLDDLLKSLFLKIFGDPVRNEKGWDKPELKAFGKISTGNTPPRNDLTNYDDDFIEWIKTDNIPGSSVYVTSSTEYLSEIGAKKSRTVTNGALLVACIAGSLESIGRSALTNRKVSFNQQINAIQPGEDINPLYLYGLFKISKAYIQSHATKGMKKILTKGDFEQIKMIKPPLDIQNQFAALVEKIESIKSFYQQSHIDLTALYGALSQKAMKGDLDLSRVLLPDMEPAEEKNMPIEPVKPHAEEILTPILPDTDILIDALENAETRKILVARWLETYREQLGTTPLSVQHFMEMAQTRLAELHPDNDYELGANDYEYIKSWIFEGIASGKLIQAFDEAGNRVQLKAIQV